MWSSTQIPHITRFFLAAVLGISECKIRVIAPDVGGGFGGKLQTTPEEFITVLRGPAHAASPCKYTETRSESLMVGPPRSRPVAEPDPGGDKDGIVTALKVDLLADLGAYAGTVGGGVPILGAFMYNAIYKFPAYQFNCTNIYTNKTLDRRLPGRRATGGDVRHRAADGRARRRARASTRWRSGRRTGSSTRSSRSPRCAGLEYDSGNYEAATAKAKEMFGYDDLRAEQKQRRESGDPVQLGIGVSTFTEMCGLAPSRVLGQLNYGAGGWEHAEVRMLPTGKVEVVTGVSAHGQGHETAFSQIVADRLGVAVRGRRGAARRHPGLAQGARHLRLAFAGRGRRGAGPGGGQGDREGQADRGAPARGERRRHRVQGRAARVRGTDQGVGDR